MKRIILKRNIIEIIQHWLVMLAGDLFQQSLIAAVGEALLALDIYAK